MKRLAWLTDIHLNFVSAAAMEQFLDGVVAARPDGVLLGGDIAEARDLIGHLKRIAATLPCPVYFVLGNHDFYRGSIGRVRAHVAELCAATPQLVWLSNAGMVELTPEVGLVGHDGWADARLGDYERSMVMMNDYRLIEELAGLGKAERWQLLKRMGDEAAEHVHRMLPRALDAYPHVVFLTHVPPLREACWYEGQISDDEWLPHFTCLAVGQALLKIMGQRPDRKLTVLCGHTHSPGETWPLANLRILTGGAEYGLPSIQRVFEL
ncbi:MAG TPA: metallophosphoesterase [Pirellulales bacterium]|nr:metallophosphoesterase [Pirellulales bacterium]